jgi:hypothetical protein
LAPGVKQRVHLLVGQQLHHDLLAVRVVVIYSVGIPEAVWLTEVPGLIAVTICLIASARAGKQLETLVNDRMEYVSGHPA